MKNLKKILFSMLLLVVGVITVNAETVKKDVEIWGSIVSPIRVDVEGNCKESTPVLTSALDFFIANNGSGKVCVITGLSEIDYDADADEGGYVALAQAPTADSAGDSYYGSVIASPNDMTDTNILLSELVQLIYHSNTTTKLKEFALSSKAAAGYGSATEYVLKAGSSNDALYVYGGYYGGKMSSIKLTYDQSTKKFSYSIEKTADNNDEFFLATYFTLYLTDYLMEASPSYSTAMSTLGASGNASVTSTENYKKIKSQFESTYGSVKYPSTTQIVVDMVANGNVNTKAVELYNTAGTEKEEEKEETPKEETPKEETKTDETESENPNTGAFVNIFAIIALLSVGTVLVLGNKRKLFKI